MLPPIDYLRWAIETFPHARLDLATSGLRSISSDELGVPGGLSDILAPHRFAEKVAARYGVPVTEVVPALGTSGALWMIAASILSTSADATSSPPHVVVEDPTYEPLLRVVEGCGAHVGRVVRPSAEDYRLTPARVRAALTPATRLVVVASPHNPTGVVTPDEDLREMALICAERGAYLLVDEVYRELVAPATTARVLGPNVLVSSSLTKCFGVGWARAGWALVPSDLSPALRVAENHSAGVLPTVSCAIGAHAFGQIEHLAERARLLSQGKRQIVDAFLAQHPELSWTPPSASSLFGFVHAPGVDVVTGLQRAAHDHGVVAVPGSHFGDDHAFRLSWASLSGERLTQALQLLAASLQLKNAAPPRSSEPPTA